MRSGGLLGAAIAVAASVAMAPRPAAAVVDYNATVGGSVIVNGTTYYLGGSSRELSPKFLGPAALTGSVKEDIVINPIGPPPFHFWKNIIRKYKLMGAPGSILMATQVGDSGVIGYNFGPNGQIYDNFVVTSVSPYTVAHTISGSMTIPTDPAVLPFRVRDEQFTWGPTSGQGCATLSAEVPPNGIIETTVTVSATYSLAAPSVSTPVTFFDHHASIDTINLGNGDFTGQVVRTNPPVASPVKVFVAKQGAVVKSVERGTFPVPSLADGPTVDGGSIRVSGATAGVFAANLPALGWKALGNPPGSKGFKYKGTGAPGDPCKVVLVKSTIVKAVCKGPDVTLAPDSGTIDIDVQVGSGDYRAQCDASTVAGNPATVIKRKDCPPPVLGCPASPSGAFLDAADML